MLTGKWEQAEKYCLDCLAIRESALGSNHLSVAKCLCGMGGEFRLCTLTILTTTLLEIYVFRDRVKAKKWLKDSLRIREQLLGRKHHLVSRVLHDLAIICDYKVRIIFSSLFKEETGDLFM